MPRSMSVITTSGGRSLGNNLSHHHGKIVALNQQRNSKWDAQEYGGVRISLCFRGFSGAFGPINWRQSVGRASGRPNQQSPRTKYLAWITARFLWDFADFATS